MAQQYSTPTTPNISFCNLFIDHETLTVVVDYRPGRKYQKLFYLLLAVNYWRAWVFFFNKIVWLTCIQENFWNCFKQNLPSRDFSIYRKNTCFQRMLHTIGHTQCMGITCANTWEHMLSLKEEQSVQPKLYLFQFLPLVFLD